MSDIIWGPAIEVNGKRPEWLSAEIFSVKNSMGWHDDNRPANPEDCAWIFSNGGINITHIRLPADHPYYTATATGFTYWPGGDVAPTDWVGYGDKGNWPDDGNEHTVLYRGYGTGHPEPSKNRWKWGQFQFSAGDIIGYRPRTEPLAEITQAVTDYYAGCVKIITPSIPGMWDIRWPNGEPILYVHVRKKRGRYLFADTHPTPTKRTNP